MKEKIKYSIIVAMTVVVLIYLFFAFVLAEWNPFIWGKYERFVLVFLEVVFSVIIVGVVLDNYKEK